MQDPILKRPLQVEINERDQAYIVVAAPQAEGLKKLFEREGVAYRTRKVHYNEDVFFDFGPDEDLVRVQAILDGWPNPPHPLV